MPPRSLYLVPVIICAVYLTRLLFKSNEPSYPHFLSRHGEYSPLHEYKYLIKRHPMLIFSKSHCPYSSRAKSLLVDTLEINPKPHVVELDLHPHGSQLQSLIASQTGRRTVPNVIVKGTSIGGSDDVASMHEKGLLVQTLRQYNLSVK